jgi:hypothetical protein
MVHEVLEFATDLVEALATRQMNGQKLWVADKAVYFVGAIKKIE